MILNKPFNFIRETLTFTLELLKTKFMNMNLKTQQPEIIKDEIKLSITINNDTLVDQSQTKPHKKFRIQND